MFSFRDRTCPSALLFPAASIDCQDVFPHVQVVRKCGMWAFTSYCDLIMPTRVRGRPNFHLSLKQLCTRHSVIYKVTKSKYVITINTMTIMMDDQVIQTCMSQDGDKDTDKVYSKFKTWLRYIRDTSIYKYNNNYSKQK